MHYTIASAQNGFAVDSFAATATPPEQRYVFTTLLDVLTFIEERLTADILSLQKPAGSATKLPPPATRDVKAKVPEPGTVIQPGETVGGVTNVSDVPIQVPTRTPAPTADPEPIVPDPPVIPGPFEPDEQNPDHALAIEMAAAGFVEDLSFIAPEHLTARLSDRLQDLCEDVTVDPLSMQEPGRAFVASLRAREGDGSDAAAEIQKQLRALFGFDRPARGA